MRRTLAAAALLCAAVLSPSPSRAQGVVCERAAADVVADARADIAAACDGAGEAFGFLARLELTLPARVTIELVPRLPADTRGDAVGCYMTESRRVLVLPMRDFLRRETWFGVPTSPVLYRSVVAHEVAHAIVGCHLGDRRLPMAAAEYVAYVTMFATMDAATREAALGLSSDVFRDAAEINDIRYALDPMRFGVTAYRHWLQQPDREAFLRRMIAGEVVTELVIY